MSDEEVDFNEAGFQEEDTENILKNINKLKRSDQEIVKLHYIDGLSHREIAGVLGIERGASKMRGARAIKRLKIIANGGELHKDDSSNIDYVSLFTEENLGKLTDKNREILDLFYNEEMTHSQIAEHLDIPKNTSKTRLNHAKKSLLKNIEEPKQTILEVKNTCKVFKGKSPSL